MSPPVESPTDDLGRLWAWFARHQFRGYSPLYERIAEGVSVDADVLGLVREAPPEAHLPPVLLAAVHYRLLEGLDHPLAEVYAGHSAADPVPLFLEICRDHGDEIAALLAVRRVQTNDCGRTGMLGPGLTWIAAQRPGDLALLDVGASAGLNLVGDRYRLDYGQYGATGSADSPVHVDCRVIGGSPPIASRLPPFLWRVGLDREPVDLADGDDARWLLACVWPDSGRLDRTAASIRLAQESPPPVRRGQALTGLARLLDEVDERAPTATAVVMNSWSFSYFGREERVAYITLLSEASRRRPIAWLVADDAVTVGEIPALDHGAVAGEHSLGAVFFDDGRLTAGQPLASVQQHGAWIDWWGKAT
ncbi:MAG: DUF2332 domain-containing protein [Acidimicrobiales bacterium]